MIYFHFRIAQSDIVSPLTFGESVWRPKAQIVTHRTFSDDTGHLGSGTYSGTSSPLYLEEVTVQSHPIIQAQLKLLVEVDTSKEIFTWGAWNTSKRATSPESSVYDPIFRMSPSYFEPSAALRCQGVTTDFRYQIFMTAFVHYVLLFPSSDLKPSA